VEERRIGVKALDHETLLNELMKGENNLSVVLLFFKMVLELSALTTASLNIQ